MKKVTSTDVAKRAGVSQTAVSITLNNSDKINLSQATRDKIIAIAKELQYGPFAERELIPFQKNEIVVILPTVFNPYYTMLLDAIESIAFEQSYKINYCCTNKSIKKEKAILENIDYARTKCVIYTFTPQSKSVAVQISKKLPLCIYGEGDIEINALLIPLNSRKAGYLLAEYMYQKGHQKLAFLSSPLDTLSTARKNRLDGVLDFAREKGFDDAIIIKTTENDENDFETGSLLANELIEQNAEINGIIAVNDMTAIGVLNALRSKNIQVPNQIGVAGFDNIPFSREFYPQLTTVDHSLLERTKIALSILLNEDENKGLINISYPPIIIGRESC